MAEYRRSAHAVFDIKYHMVWITKYRCKVLKGSGASARSDTTDLRSAGRGDSLQAALAASCDFQSQPNPTAFRRGCLVAFASGGLPILTTLGGTMAGPLSTALTLVFTGVAIALFARQVQGGSRLSPVSFSPNPAGDRAPDDCWKWGLFYVNPDAQRYSSRCDLDWGTR